RRRPRPTTRASMRCCSRTSRGGTPRGGSTRTASSATSARPSTPGSGKRRRRAASPARPSSSRELAPGPRQDGGELCDGGEPARTAGALRGGGGRAGARRPAPRDRRMGAEAGARGGRRPRRARTVDARHARCAGRLRRPLAAHGRAGARARSGGAGRRRAGASVRRRVVRHRRRRVDALPRARHPPRALRDRAGARPRRRADRGHGLRRSSRGAALPRALRAPARAVQPRERQRAARAALRADRTLRRRREGDRAPARAARRLPAVNPGEDEGDPDGRGPAVRHLHARVDLLRDDVIRPAELIQRKRDGEELPDEELADLILGYARGEVPDYQMAAFCMAVYFRGLTPHETYVLTDAMVRSGDTIDMRSALGRKVVDKHSTGGVGDKTSLAVAPIVAACGVPLGKMSGRGLGHTGGTLDKLESIPGYRTELSLEEFVSQVRDVGCAIVGQTSDLVPADKLLYALRDVTATVDQLSLIAASIMSKKLAGGAQAIVLDVKVGDGAFMKTLEDARRLAETMRALGEQAGREVVCLLTDMDQPLGAAVGNALEVREALETVRGRGPADFGELVLDACAKLLELSDLGID